MIEKSKNVENCDEKYNKLYKKTLQFSTFYDIINSLSNWKVLKFNIKFKFKNQKVQIRTKTSFKNQFKNPDYNKGEDAI